LITRSTRSICGATPGSRLPQRADLAPGALEAEEPAGVDLKMPRAPQLTQRRRAALGQPMPVHVPVGTQVPQEASALGCAEPLPQARRQRARQRRRFAPVAALRIKFLRQHPHRAPQLPQRPGGRQQQRPSIFLRGAGRQSCLLRRQQAATRERMERGCTGAGGAAGEHHVGHRQAGPDEQHRFSRAHGGFRRPGIGDVARRVA
jgi:hypothetical protein